MSAELRFGTINGEKTTCYLVGVEEQSGESMTVLALLFFGGAPGELDAFYCSSRDRWELDSSNDDHHQGRYSFVKKVSAQEVERRTLLKIPRGGGGAC